MNDLQTEHTAAAYKKAKVVLYTWNLYWKTRKR